MFLSTAQESGLGSVKIPAYEADLIFFVIRKFVEQYSVIEHYLFIKDHENIKAELQWLLQRTDRARINEILKPGYQTLNQIFLMNVFTRLKIILL